MPAEAISDEAPVTQIVHAPVATTMPVAPVPPPKANPETPIFNSMADKLTSLLRGTPEVVTEKPKAPDAPVVPGEPAKPEEGKWTSKKAEEWKQLKTRMSEIETKAKNMGDLLKAKEAEIETLKKQPITDPKELEALRSERDTLSARLESVALDRHPKFADHYQQIFNKTIASAKDAAGSEHAELVEHLLQLKPSAKRKAAMDDILDSIPSISDRQKLSSALEKMDDTRAEREEAITTKAKENLEKIAMVEAAERTKMSELQKGQRKDKIEKVLTLAGNLDAFTVQEGDEAFNNTIPARTERVRKALMGELPENELMLMPLLAEEAVHLREAVLPKMITKMKEMEATIAQLSGSQPNVDGHGAPTAPVNDDGSGFVANFHRLYKGPTRRQ